MVDVISRRHVAYKIIPGKRESDGDDEEVYLHNFCLYQQLDVSKAANNSVTI